jgi:DnaJ-class molecular chaperone
VVHWVDHKFYRVIGDFDLGITIIISLKEALLGFKRKIRLLDGSFTTLEQHGVT